MAYVVARKGGRFEIRESLHTSKGPRARTLAGFRILTNDVLLDAAQRAQRPFDPQAVIGSGRRAGAQVQVAIPDTGLSRDRFLLSTRRMAHSLRQPRSQSEAVDPGTALIELLGFADTVMASQPPRPFEALAFPPLRRIAEQSDTTEAVHAR